MISIQNVITSSIVVGIIIGVVLTAGAVGIYSIWKKDSFGFKKRKEEQNQKETEIRSKKIMSKVQNFVF